MSLLVIKKVGDYKFSYKLLWKEGNELNNK